MRLEVRLASPSVESPGPFVSLRVRRIPSCCPTKLIFANLKDARRITFIYKVQLALLHEACQSCGIPLEMEPIPQIRNKKSHRLMARPVRPRERVNRYPH